MSDSIHESAPKMACEDVHNIVESHAKTKNLKHVRVIDQIEIGQAIRQGDIYLIRIPKKPKEYTAQRARMTDNLAPGVTEGSRHTINLGAKCEVFDNPSNTDPLLGPVVVAGDEFSLLHPEHAHFKLPAGTYQCRFQQDWDAEERRRVRD